MALNEMSVASYRIIQGFNDIFSEIINSDMKQPTFNDWFTDKWQMCQKRPWWIKLFSMAEDIIDYYKFNNIFYVLEKINTTNCKLWKVSKSPTTWLYTVKTDLTPVAWIKYDPLNIRGTVLFSAPDLTSIKITESTPTNVADPSLNPYWDYSDTLKDTVQTFDNTYFNVYWVITSHSEVKVKDVTVATPPGTPANGDRYIVATWWTWAWSGKDWQIAQWNSTTSLRDFTIPHTAYFTWSVAQSKTYRCEVTAWPTYTWVVCVVDNGWKEWTRFDVQATLDANTLRIVSPVTLNNFDSYSIYWVLSTYTVFKKTWDATIWKTGINTANDSVLYFPSFLNTRDLVIFDWSLFWCTPTRVYQKSWWQELSKTATNNFYFYESELYSLDSTWDFLFVWANNRTYALVRITQNTSTAGAAVFTYGKREITQFWLFSRRSILTYWGSMYAYLNDWRWYWLNLSFTSQSAQVQLKDVGIKVQYYLDHIDPADYVEWFWQNGNFWFTVTWTVNRYIRYNEPYEWFLVNEYSKWFKYFELSDSIVNCIEWKDLFEQWWDKDDTDDIDQRIVMIAPEGVVGTPFRSVQWNLLFWYDGTSIIKWRAEIEIDSWPFLDTLVYDSDKFQSVQLLNAFGDGTLATRLLWMGVLWIWWGNPYAGKYGRVGLRIGKTCTMNKITIRNVENSNLIFGRFDLLYETASPMVIPIRDIW